MRRAAVLPHSFPEPISTPNITPLIDVMLVLLIVFIISLPPATNQVPLNLPSNGPAPQQLQVRHLLELGRGGQVVLDGAALSDAALAARAATLAADRGALLVMRTDPAARYERFDQVLAVVKHAGITRLGFDGNDRMTW